MDKNFLINSEIQVERTQKAAKLTKLEETGSGSLYSTN